MPTVKIATSEHSPKITVTICRPNVHEIRDSLCDKPKSAGTANASTKALSSCDISSQRVQAARLTQGGIRLREYQKRRFDLGEGDFLTEIRPTIGGKIIAANQRKMLFSNPIQTTNSTKAGAKRPAR